MPDPEKNEVRSVRIGASTGRRPGPLDGAGDATYT